MDISNGEGIGVALFVQGCHFKCKGCFNPETWDFSGGKEWTEEIKEKFLELVDRPYIKRVSLLGGECLAEENLDNVLDLVTEINKRYNTTQDRVYATDKNNNILTGFPHEIRLSKPKKSIWLYTGYEVVSVDGEYKRIIFDRGSEDIVEQFSFKSVINHNKRTDIASMCDVIVDGRYIDSKRDVTYPFAGSRNQRVIDVLKSIENEEVVLYK